MTYTRRIENDTIIISDTNRDIISIKEEADDASMIFGLKGELLNEIAFELEDELLAGMSVRNILRVDMEGLTYIASVGLRSLLKVQHLIDERDKGELILCNLSSQIKDIFRQNGFLELFEIR